jgi:hypothetical protein
MLTIGLKSEAETTGISCLHCICVCGPWVKRVRPSSAHPQHRQAPLHRTSPSALIQPVDKVYGMKHRRLISRAQFVRKATSGLPAKAWIEYGYVRRISTSSSDSCGCLIRNPRIGHTVANCVSQAAWLGNVRQMQHARFPRGASFESL